MIKIQIEPENLVIWRRLSDACYADEKDGAHRAGNGSIAESVTDIKRDWKSESNVGKE